MASDRDRHYPPILYLLGVEADLYISAYAKPKNYPILVDLADGFDLSRLPGHPAVRKKWIDAIPGKISSHGAVCASHFKPEDYAPLTRRLKFGAVPSVFPNCELWLKVVRSEGVVELPIEQVENLQVCFRHRQQYLKEIKLVKKSNKQSKDESSDQSDNESIHQENVLSSRTRPKRNKRKTESIQYEESYDTDHSDQAAGDDHDYVASDNGDNYDNEDSEDSEEYQCSECQKQIKGFLYTCVQCAGWDLCGACEARGAHDTHYVLRVPRNRKHKETKAVLKAIKEQLLRNNVLTRDDNLNRTREVLEFEVPPPSASPAPVKTERPNSDSDYIVEALDEEWLSDEETDKQIRKRHRAQNDHSVPTKKTKLDPTSKKGQSKAIQKTEKSITNDRSTENSLPYYDDITRKTSKMPTLVLNPLPLKSRTKPKTPVSRKPLADAISTTDGGGNEENCNEIRLRVPADTDEQALVQALQSRVYVMMKPLEIAIRKLSDMNK